MERLQTKRTLARVDLEKLSDELMLLKTTDDLEPEQEDRIAEIRAELEVIAKDLKQQDALIDPHVSGDDFAEECAGVRKYQALLTRMRTRLGRLQRRSLSGGGMVNGSTTALSSTSSAWPLKLPKLELQKFNGDRLGWQPFWERFRQAVHENCALSNIERFLYPHAVLTGKAAAAVSDIQASEQNYDCTIKTLKEHFGRQDVLVQEHLTQLLNLQTVKRLDDVNALRRLHDNIRRNVAGLKNLGVQPDTYSGMLCAVLFRVLLTKLAVEFHKTHATDKDVLDSSTLDAILGSLRLELDSRGRAHHHTGLRTSVVEPASSLSNELRAFWELESLGIATKDGPSGDDEHVRHDFVHSLSFVDGRYEASLPWKPLDRPLESNEAVERQRLNKLLRCLKPNNERLYEYDKTIRSYLEGGFAERVPANEIQNGAQIYYMLHRAVLRPGSSMTKVRIVFDASAKAQGCMSLNHALATGLSLNPELLQLLLNFRRHAIAITAV
ncbi:hypothetical protein MTO96_005139 [Rhipicephalus appendiculatus]